MGFGVGGGSFGAFRAPASVRAVMTANGILQLYTSVSDIGPGTGTVMATIASETLGLDADKIKIHIGDSTLPNAPLQGGSSKSASICPSVKIACTDLKEKFQKLAGNGGTDQPKNTALLK